VKKTFIEFGVIYKIDMISQISFFYNHTASNCFIFESHFIIDHAIKALIIAEIVPTNVTYGKKVKICIDFRKKTDEIVICVRLFKNAPPTLVPISPHLNFLKRDTIHKTPHIVPIMPRKKVGEKSLPAKMDPRIFFIIATVIALFASINTKTIKTIELENPHLKPGIGIGTGIIDSKKYIIELTTMNIDK